MFESNVFLRAIWGHKSPSFGYCMHAFVFVCVSQSLSLYVYLVLSVQ